ncbi:Rieske 2Fe-2S domain-containing protein [Candidatus Uhrbacteria bacterium]|nr:Rieske 2Fe-2S domain-containing protein [Candidatus Uhrbacteria bacterium]
MKRTSKRIVLTLCALIAGIIAIPFFPALSERSTLIFSLLLLGVLLYAVWERAWVDVLLSAVAFAVIAGSPLLIPSLNQTTRLLSLFGLMAYLGLQAVLLIGPWTRFIPRLVWMYAYRRHLGVSVFLLALAHASLIFSSYFSYSISTVLSYLLTMLGFTGLFILLVLAATSFDKLQKRVPLSRWKTLHHLLLVLFASAVAYFFTNGGTAVETSRWFFVLVLIYWTLISPCALPKRWLRFVNGWKQLHLLIYAAYASVLIHVWTARVSAEVPFKKAGFFALAALVIGSHIVGWIFFFIKRRQERARYPKRIWQGEDWYVIGRNTDVIEGVGRKLVVEKTDLAVFRYHGKVCALLDRCPHQGGPLSQGKIVEGYVICPWHGYQFDVENGKGPAEFGDSVPRFKTVEWKNEVLVCLTSESPQAHGCQESHCCQRPQA